MMKCQSLLLSLGAVVLTALSSFSGVSQAQDTGSQPQIQTLSTQLELTPDQQAQVGQIQTFLDAQIKTILTPEQYSQAQAMRTAGNSSPSPLEALNLSSSQKGKLQEAEQIASQRFYSILTPAQQQKLLELLKSSPK